MECYRDALAVEKTPVQQVAAVLRGLLSAKGAWLLCALLCVNSAIAVESFYNPIIADGADPWIVQKDGFYYYTHTTGGDVQIRKAKAILGTNGLNAAAPVRVFNPPAPYEQAVWAPELHYLNGKWYIYYAADDGDNANHRMFVAEAATADPLGSYTYKGKICDPADRWAIDGTVLQMDNGLLYFIWSGWPGSVNEQQNLYIAPMSNPWTISGARVMISMPTYGWEGWIQEGPQVIKQGGKIHIVYSANASWTDDYCLGLLTCADGNVMNAASWTKKSKPVFQSYSDVNGTVWGPGHCSFTKSVDSSEDWIIHHSAKYSDAGWIRHVRAQRFTWNADGSPNFDVPVPPASMITAPSGERAVPAPGATFTLKVTPEPAGTVRVSPSQSNYAPGTVVTLTASNTPGLTFVGWAGDAWGTNPVLSVKLDRNKAVTAYFTPVVIVDNTEASYVGNWPTGSAFPGYGPDYQWANGSTSATQTATFRPNLPVAGRYDIHVMYSSMINRSAATPHLISSQDGAGTGKVNQTIGGAQWQLLAAGRSFAKGTTGFVEISNLAETNRAVIADAVRFLYCTNQGQRLPHFDSDLILTSGVFRVKVSGGVGGQSYAMQASTNLTGWTTLRTSNTPSGVIEFTDDKARNFNRRFYRVVGQ